MINKISSCGRITTEVKWPLVKLNEACSLNMGQSPDSSGYNDEGKGLPFYQGNADFGTLTPVTRLFCNNPTKIAHAGDILLSVRAPIGAVNIANQTCCIGRGLAALTAYRDVDVKFLYYAIKSKHGEFNAKGTGSTFKAINKKALYETRIPLPALAEQKNIANILDNVSNLISLCKKQIMQLDLLVKSRFIEMFGDPVTNPKGWESGTIRDIASEVKYGTSSPATEGGKHIYLRMNNITYDGHLDLSNLKYIDLPDDQLAKYQVQKGDVLFNRTNSKELVGKTCVFKEDIPMVIAGYIIRVRVNARANPEYLSAILNSKYGKRTLLDMCKAIVGQANINAQELQNIDILIPPISLQNEFATFIEELDKSKFTIRKSLEKLETLYRALLQEYFG